MPPGVLYGGVPVDVGEQAQAEPIVVVVGRVGEAIHNHGVVLKYINY